MINGITVLMKVVDGNQYVASDHSTLKRLMCNRVITLH